MSETTVAYRSASPAAVEAWKTWQADMKSQQERVAEFIARHNPDGALDARVWHSPGYRFAYFEGDTAPEGWRKSPNGRILPDKRTKPGKAAAGELGALTTEGPGALVSRLDGMPEHAVANGRMYSPGSFFHDGAVYVSWGARPEEEPSSEWEELKLSEFYAAKEAYDPAHAEKALA
jgi:hypothetical protein